MNRHWTDDAACRPDPAWTMETEPDPYTLDRLASICFDCPVRRKCAVYALETNAQSGVYAGIYVPPRAFYIRRSVKWELARLRLADVAKGKVA